jgi:hypothetical protein
MDKIKHLTEQIFHEQDKTYNLLASDHIALGNFTVDRVMPYLENRALSRDHAAQEILRELVTLLEEFNY